MADIPGSLDNSLGSTTVVVNARSAFCQDSVKNEMSPQADTRPRRALVVEDAHDVRIVVVGLLEREGFTVEECNDGAECVERVRARDPDLVILDVALPSLSGVEACRRIRAFSDVYVLMLTAKDGEVDKVVAFSAGADDYVTKPFSPAELVARVRALMRRPRATDGQDGDARRRFGPLVIDAGSRQVWLDGATLELTRTEFDLLEALSSAPRMAFSRSQLIEHVWGESWFGDDHLVDVHISNLRRKLGEHGRTFIKTVRGVGFRMGAG
jgi:DNA-binding response OmpR family regulator